MNRAIEQYRFHEVAQTLWEFFWHEFCDWYLELKKLRLEDGSGLNPHWRNLLTVYEMALRLLHPADAVPYRRALAAPRFGMRRQTGIHRARLLPSVQCRGGDPEAEYDMSILQAIISAARELRADMKSIPSDMDAVLSSASRLKTSWPRHFQSRNSPDSSWMFDSIAEGMGVKR